MYSSFLKIMTFFNEQQTCYGAILLKKMYFLKHTMTSSKIELPRVSYLLVGHDRTRNATIIERWNLLTTTPNRFSSFLMLIKGIGLKVLFFLSKNHCLLISIGAPPSPPRVLRNFIVAAMY